MIVESCAKEVAAKEANKKKQQKYFKIIFIVEFIFTEATL